MRNKKVCVFKVDLEYLDSLLGNVIVSLNSIKERGKLDGVAKLWLDEASKDVEKIADAIKRSIE